VNDNINNGHTGGPPIPGGAGRRLFRPGDVAVGDWVWAAGAWRGHPVIRVNRHTVTVGIHRARGGWLTTENLRWADIRGVIPAVSDLPTDLAQTLDNALRRVVRGFLDAEHRAALAALLQIAGTATLPTRVTAVLFTAITALARDVPPVDQPHPDQNTDTSEGSEGSSEDDEEDRS
jgi:hypothetical protein